MNPPQPKSGLPTIILVVLGACGGCLALSIAAIALLVGAVTTNPTYVLARTISLESRHRYAEAEKLLVPAVRKAPTNALLLNNLAWLYYLEGKYSLGIPYAERAVELNRDPSFVDTLAHLHLGLRDFAAAEREFKSVLAAAPSIAESHDGLGQVYEQQGDFKQALQEYKTALQLNAESEGTQVRINHLRAAKPRSGSKN